MTGNLDTGMLFRAGTFPNKISFGNAWLEFEVTEDGNGSIIRQTAIFDPAGLQGLLVWYYFYLFHRFVFSGMLRGISRAARNVEKPS
jgi:hypothetical protein